MNFRGYKSPKDISMDLKKLNEDLGIRTTIIEDGLMSYMT